MTIMNISVKGGVQPTGTKPIISNGIYDVAGYANADVQVPTTAPDMYLAYNLSSAGVLSRGSAHIVFEQIKDISAECLRDVFDGDTSISGVINLENLEGISGSRGFESTFQGCTNITGVNLGSLTSVIGSYGAVNMFRNCTGFNSPVDLSSLTSVSGSYAFSYAFAGSGITGVDLSSLQSITASHGFEYAFSGCTSLVSANLGVLTTVGSYGCSNMFNGCTSLISVNLGSLTTVGSNGCANMFDGCAGITGALDLSSITTVGDYGCYQMFAHCNGITSADCSEVETVNGTSVLHGLFGWCNGITSADFSNLKSVSGNSAIGSIFYDCPNLVSVDFSSLTFIGLGLYPLGTLFYGCTSLQSVRFDSLAVVNASNAFQSAFQGATSLTTLSFPSLSSRGNTGIFYIMLSGIRGCTIHFPKNLDPQTGSTVISGLQTYPNFGGTNTVLVFDLPSTLTLTGADTVTYTRNPKYDTATALAWKVGAYGTTNFTPAYYTSGTADPVVSDTIYSDSACTMDVTTISSII